MSDGSDLRAYARRVGAFGVGEGGLNQRMQEANARGLIPVGSRGRRGYLDSESLAAINSRQRINQSVMQPFIKALNKPDGQYHRLLLEKIDEYNLSDETPKPKNLVKALKKALNGNSIVWNKHLQPLVHTSFYSHLNKVYTDFISTHFNQ